MTGEPLHPHRWNPLAQPAPYGRDDYATHDCDACGMVVELDEDGNPVNAINFECSGRLGDY